VDSTRQAKARDPDLARRSRAVVVSRHCPDYLTIAVILGAHGLRGDLKIHLEPASQHLFASLERVYLGPKHLLFAVESLRPYRNLHLLKLKGCDDRSCAEELRGLEVLVPLADVGELPAGQFFEYQLEGLSVETEEGEPLGILHEVLFTGSNPVYVARSSSGELLIPALTNVVLSVDLQAGKMVVRLPAGMRD